MALKKTTLWRLAVNRFFYRLLYGIDPRDIAAAQKEARFAGVAVGWRMGFEEAALVCESRNCTSCADHIREMVTEDFGR